MIISVWWGLIKEQKRQSALLCKIISTDNKITAGFHWEINEDFSIQNETAPRGSTLNYICPGERQTSVMMTWTSSCMSNSLVFLYSLVHLVHQNVSCIFGAGIWDKIKVIKFQLTCPQQPVSYRDPPQRQLHGNRPNPLYYWGLSHDVSRWICSIYSSWRANQH